MCPGLSRAGPPAKRVPVWRRVRAVKEPAVATLPQRSPPAGLAGGAAVRSAAPRRVSVWRRISIIPEPVDAALSQWSLPAGVTRVMAAAAQQGNSAMMALGSGDGSDSRPGRRRRRRSRFRQRVGQVISDAPPEARPVVSSEVVPVYPPAFVQPLPCIINWTDLIARAEEDLKHAVIVNVSGDEPLADASVVAAAIAARMEIEPNSLVLRRASASSYLLVLPDLVSVDHLVGLQQPLRNGNFSLLCKKWSRLMGVAGKVLPWPIDVELRNIPSHVWETSTVEHLLSPHAWVQNVHQDTLNLIDLSVFRCLAWCSDPHLIPSSRKLWVSEPPVAVEEDPPVKRVLEYDIDIRFSIRFHPDGSAANPPSPPGDDDDSVDSQRRRRSRRLRSPSPPRPQPGC